MKIEEQNVILRKIIASEGKVFIKKDNDVRLSQEAPKLIYLGINDNPENYKEIDEETYREMYEEYQKKMEEEGKEGKEEI